MHPRRELYNIGYKNYRNSERGKEIHKLSQEHWNNKNQLKIKVQQKLGNFFYRNNISNEEFHCAICKKQPIEKHHENYDLWYSFIPLCRNHHAEIHMVRRC